MRLMFVVTMLVTLQGTPRPHAIDDIGWLAGCWTYSSGARTVEEHWLEPRAHTMVSAGRTVQDDRLVEFEQVVIREQDGQLAYEAHPSGQSSAVFVSKSLGDKEVVFENLQHDFPQRVGYKRDGDSLIGWIEGTRNGQSRRIEFPYRRVSCS